MNFSQGLSTTVSADQAPQRRNDLNDHTSAWITKRIATRDNIKFLQSPLECDIRQLQSKMSMTEWIVFLFLIVLHPFEHMVKQIARFPQKSKTWLLARQGRLTGSMAAAAVGHSRINFPLQKAKESQQEYVRISSLPMDWGSGKELYGTQSYVNDLRDQVHATFIEQRLAAAKEHGPAFYDKWKYFLFRHQWIPVGEDPAILPQVQVRGYGFTINVSWRGMSPDGIVFINDLAVGCIEVKCAFKDNFALYPNIYEYYYDQLQCELYIGKSIFPTLQWLDFINWTPDGFTVDEYLLDEEYMYTWFLPREIRYYFRVFLPAFVAALRVKFASINPLPRTIRSFWHWIQQTFKWPA